MSAPATYPFLVHSSQWQRPCICGHPKARHNPQCSEPGCECRSYTPDQSPEFLLRLGIRSGEWQFVTIPQLRWLMRPEQSLSVRVWACGMIHSIGHRRTKKGADDKADRRGRLAVKLGPHGVATPLTPQDIVNELNALDTIGRVTRQNVRRALLELEAAGAVRRTGKAKGNVRLFFYLRPLKAKRVSSESEKIVVKFDYNFLASDSKNNHLLDSQVLHIKNVLVKAFLRSLRAEAGDIVSNPDYKKIVDETLQEVLNVVSSAYQKLRIVVCNGSPPHPPNKEASISSNACMQACQLAGLRDLFPDDHLADSYLETIDAAIRQRWPGYDPSEFIRFVYSRQRRKPIGPGLLPALANDFANRPNGHRPVEKRRTPPSSPRDEQKDQIHTWLRILEDDPSPAERASVLSKLAAADPELLEEVRAERGGRP